MADLRVVYGEKGEIACESRGRPPEGKYIQKLSLQRDPLNQPATVRGFRWPKLGWEESSITLR